MHVHRVGSPDSASAVSGGSDNGQTSEITVIGNLFFDVDQAMTAKEGNFFTFLNNTVVDQNSRGSEDRLEDIVNKPDAFLPAVLNFGDDGIPHARGMYIEGNVIHSAEKLVRNYTGTELVTFNNNLFPSGITWAGAGSGNTSGPALLNDVSVNAATGASNIPTPTKDNYRRVAEEIRKQFGLDPRSPARGTGPNGTDKGGIRSLGVSLSGGRGLGHYVRRRDRLGGVGRGRLLTLRGLRAVEHGRAARDDAGDGQRERDRLDAQVGCETLHGKSCP